MAQATNFVMAFGSSIIVARLVSPRDFGIFGMAVAITAILNIFLQFGLTRYIVRERELDIETLRSLFTVNTILTLGYFCAIHIGAYVCFLTKSPEVGHFLIVFSLFPLIAIFEFIPNSLCAREMRFGLISAMAVVRGVVVFSVTIALAYLGFAYMSFAWASVLASLSTSLCYNYFCFRPDVWRFRLRGFRQLVRFGIDMIGVSGLSQLSARGGEMSLGSLLGLANLGLYTRASNLPNVLYSNVYGVGTSVIFSRLSRELRETGTFHETYFRFMRLLLGVLWPVMFGMAVLAQPLVYILYGAKWQGAATPLAMLMISTSITLAIGMSAEVFVLRHETRRQAKIETFRAAFSFLLFIGGAAVSLTLAAAAKLVEVAMAYLIYRRPMDRLVGAPRGDLERVYKEALLLSLLACGPSLALMVAHDWSPTTSLVEISTAVLVGVGLWVAALMKRRHPIRHEFGSLAATLRSKRTSVSSQSKPLQSKPQD